MIANIQFPNYIPNYEITFYRKVEPVNKKEGIKEYITNKNYLGNIVDIYV
jgi:hypothetical protein